MLHIKNIYIQNGVVKLG